MSVFRNLQRVIFPAKLENIFSEESQERTALGIAARSRGNINVQNKPVTTDRMFKDEMARMAERVSVTMSRSRFK